MKYYNWRSPKRVHLDTCVHWEPVLTFVLIWELSILWMHKWAASFPFARWTKQCSRVDDHMTVSRKIKLKQLMNASIIWQWTSNIPSLMTIPLRIPIKTPWRIPRTYPKWYLENVQGSTMKSTLYAWLFAQQASLNVEITISEVFLACQLILLAASGYSRYTVCVVLLPRSFQFHIFFLRADQCQGYSSTDGQSSTVSAKQEVNFGDFLRQKSTLQKREKPRYVAVR